MRKFALTLFAGTAIALCAAPSAQASFGEFIAATCGAACSDTTGETSQARQNWDALVTMGTTEWIGADFNGGKIDASSLLSAARIVGASELDRWLRTGQAADGNILQTMAGALTSGSGFNVSSITGVLSGLSGGGSSLAGSLSQLASGTPMGTITSTLTDSSSINVNFMGPGGGGGDYCDEGIAGTQNAAAQKHIDDMVNIAMSNDYGFSQMGGAGVGSGQKSSDGFFGMSCLDKFMQGTRDTLFRPPQLSQLVAMIGQMGGIGGAGGGSGGGGGGGGACDGAESVLQQVAGSMPSGIFDSGANGGFFPYAGFAGREGDGSGLNFGNAFNMVSNATGGSGSVSGDSFGLNKLFSAAR